MVAHTSIGDNEDTPSYIESIQQNLTLHDIEKSNSSLRICCYGSSSSRTQERYKTDAYILGQTLSRRGHTCVNGAGAFGCMGALNKGVEDANGPGGVFGVIHEMFIKKDESSKTGKDSWLEGCAPVFLNSDNAEIFVAGGNDLQQRKKKLVENADALIVMPGGPGTFDELWEMACSKQIGIIDIPIVCVNIDGYYDHFYSILQRAQEDEFLYKQPEDILHFEPNSSKAVEWIEKFVEAKNGEKTVIDNVKTSVTQERTISRIQSAVKRMIYVEKENVTYKSGSFVNSSMPSSLTYFTLFSAGLALGLMTSSKK